MPNVPDNASIEEVIVLRDDRDVVAQAVVHVHVREVRRANYGAAKVQVVQVLVNDGDISALRDREVEVLRIGKLGGLRQESWTRFKEMEAAKDGQRLPVNSVSLLWESLRSCR